MVDIYKKASKKKLRFATSRGSLSVEQLWDLTLDDLAGLAKRASAKVKEESGAGSDKELEFLDNGGEKKNSVEQLKFEIIKDIYTSKKSRIEKEQKKAVIKERNSHLLNILAEKQEADLRNKSIEELQKMIEDDNLDDDED